MEQKLVCSFCRNTNTKWVEKTESTGLFSSRSLGKVEEVDRDARRFERCINCGEVICERCIDKMDSKKGFVFKKDICPKCSSKMIRIN
jgi:hypothetical protein